MIIGVLSCFIFISFHFYSGRVGYTLIYAYPLAQFTNGIGERQRAYRADVIIVKCSSIPVLCVVVFRLYLCNELSLSLWVARRGAARLWGSPLPYVSCCPLHR